MALAETVDAPAAHLLGWDCIEFWVGNARAMAAFFMSGFGFHWSVPLPTGWELVRHKRAGAVHYGLVQSAL